jgi:hypothetical protein
MRAALRRDLVLQQSLLALEHELADVGERHHQLVVEFAAFDLPIGRTDHDADVLADVRVLFGLEVLLERFLRAAHGRAQALAVVRLQVGDAVVVAGQAEERGEFGRELRLRPEQRLRDFVAALHPGRVRPHGRGGGAFGLLRVGREQVGSREGEAGERAGAGQEQATHGDLLELGTAADGCVPRNGMGDAAGGTSRPSSSRRRDPVPLLSG